MFIHDAVLEGVICGNTKIPVHNIHNAVVKMSKKDPKSKMTGFQLHFKVSTQIMLTFLYDKGSSLIYLTCLRRLYKLRDRTLTINLAKLDFNLLCRRRTDTKILYPVRHYMLHVVHTNTIVYIFM